MQNNIANVSTTTLQETQFASSEVVNSVIFDEDAAHTDEVTEAYIISNENTYQASNGNSYGTLEPPKPHPVTSTPKPTTSTRALAPDLLRGTVMVLQAIDHSAMSVGAWSHGQAIVSEEASRRVTKWNVPMAYTARLFTHLCAPGFMFLLGMGIVYFGRSRSRLGWSSWQMTKHFFIRALVLAALNQVLAILLARKLVTLFNIVMLALAFNYFATGILWLAITWTENQLTNLIVKFMPKPPTDSVTDALLDTNSQTSSTHPSVKEKASQISFNIHNIFLLVLVGVTAWWNIWLDPSHGQCSTLDTPPAPKSNSFFEFFFHEFSSSYGFSAFPPLAWISPAILGLLYGRIVLFKPWKPIAINVSNLLVGLAFIVLFVLTRLLHFGNLDESCLAMPEHLAHPDKNQYLASIRSFFYVIKYPPSPAFLLLAMGCNFLLLGAYGAIPAKYVTRLPLSILIVFGTSALFFYFAHLPLYFALGSIAKILFGHRLDFDDMMKPGQKAWGVGPGILFWIDWAIGLAILYPACKWYGRFKAGKGVDSIWRFF